MNPLAINLMRPPHRLLIEPIVAAALAEDLGRNGDITSDLIVPEDHRETARLVARQGGIVAGLLAVQIAFELVSRSVDFAPSVAEGTEVPAGAVLADVGGPARALLTAERVALNFLGHLSGIATSTRRLVDAVDGTKAKIVCTRKTTPGLRILEKYAVRCGGGFNHRFGLDDAVLIKDNHIAVAGSLTAAVERVRCGLAHMIKIEVEVDTLSQLGEALAANVDTVLLDNMDTQQLRAAVSLTQGRAVLEASGGVNLQSVRAIAETGVDYISAGSITHSAPSLDVALDF
ncbi:MAG TPA: carboxylating nicotinate-nucleotide diphosphorylase [Rhizomicrobium sp.]|jgi:nicotinate-nucleotide pyrophosphorylase (carboxylating)